jgi:outer membrane receptor protein involved in Fe transport
LRRRPLSLGVALAIATASTGIHAQVAGPVLDEITVTARKRTENLQDVPISVQALDSTRLTELGVASFEDYAQLLPSLSFKSFGTPGSATIYMRGVADGGNGNASGAQPSVGLYLDEQPVTAIAQNLDIHIYDVARIEALAGPQGTLFGASSESGTLRIITNQPSADAFEGRVDVSAGSTKGGDPSYSGEGFVNIPIGDKAAIRLVGWATQDGGWIDNVPGTRTYNLTAGRTNTINNDSFLENDFNSLEKYGLRAALKVDLSDSWTATAGVIHQDSKADGVWDQGDDRQLQPQPGGVIPPASVGENEIQRFADEFNNDKFTQYALTLKGEVAGQSLTYAGSYLDRDVQYQTDYSAYAEDKRGYFVPYYACDYTAYDGPVNTDCTSLYEVYHADNAYTRTSHELRLQSTGDGRLQYTVGAFLQDSEHKYLQQWFQPGMSPTQWVNGQQDLFFRTDQKREETQFALFGEATFNITDAFSATFGMRHYDETSKVQGVVGWGDETTDDGEGIPGADTPSDSKVDFSDELYKLSLAYKFNDDQMIYATYSEGYRPGGLNRDAGLIAKVGSQSWKPDTLQNYEFGWKTTWLEGRLRWNGAAYLMKWDDIQFTIYDFSLVACCGSVYNLSTAEIKGVESDLSFAATERLTTSLAFAYNDAKTTDDFILTRVDAGPPLLAVPDGTELPNVPKYKVSLQSRYEFKISDFDAYIQSNMSYTDSSWSEIRVTRPITIGYPRQVLTVPGRFKQDSYKIVNLRTGISKDTWGVDLYVSNLTDESADLYAHPRNYEATAIANRPRSFGAGIWMKF